MRSMYSFLMVMWWFFNMTCQISRYLLLSLSCVEVVSDRLHFTSVNSMWFSAGTKNIKKFQSYWKTLCLPWIATQILPNSAVFKKRYPSIKKVEICSQNLVKTAHPRNFEHHVNIWDSNHSQSTTKAKGEVQDLSPGNFPANEINQRTFWHQPSNK